MNKIQVTNNSVLTKTTRKGNDQHSVIGGHVGNELSAEELDLYRFMLGGLVGK